MQVVAADSAHTALTHLDLEGLALGRKLCPRPCVQPLAQLFNEGAHAADHHPLSLPLHPALVSKQRA